MTQTEINEAIVILSLTNRPSAKVKKETERLKGLSLYNLILARQERMGYVQRKDVGDLGVKLVPVAHAVKHAKWVLAQ